jgi:hypothetical protein
MTTLSNEQKDILKQLSAILCKGIGSAASTSSSSSSSTPAPVIENKDLKFVGIQNIAATSCYINAAIQMFYSIPEFRQLMISLKNVTEMPKLDLKVNKNRKGQIVNAKEIEDRKQQLKVLVNLYNKIIDKAKNNENQIITIQELTDKNEGQSGTGLEYDENSIYANLFIDRAYTQQDSQEFIQTKIINMLNDYGKINNFDINILSFTENSQIKCSNQEDKTNETNTYGDILTIPANKDIFNNKTMQNLIDNYQNEEDLLDDDGKTPKINEECGDTTTPKTPHKKKLSILIDENNKYLIIKLNREIYENGIGSKTEYNIKNSESIKVDNKDYRLVGFIKHSGSTLRSGHYYYYYTLKNSNNEYILANDSSISFKKDIPTNDIEKGYIYLYEKYNPSEANIEISISTTDVKIEIPENNPFYDVNNPYKFVNTPEELEFAKTIMVIFNNYDKDKQTYEVLYDKYLNSMFIYTSNNINTGYKGGKGSYTAEIGDRERTFGIPTGPINDIDNNFSITIQDNSYPKEYKNIDIPLKQHIDNMIVSLITLLYENKNSGITSIIIPINNDKTNIMFGIGSFSGHTDDKIYSYIYNQIKDKFFVLYQTTKNEEWTPPTKSLDGGSYLPSNKKLSKLSKHILKYNSKSISTSRTNKKTKRKYKNTK